MKHLVFLGVLLLCSNAFNNPAHNQDLLIIQDVVHDLYDSEQVGKEATGSFDMSLYKGILEKLKTCIYQFITDTQLCKVSNVTATEPPPTHYLYSCAYELMKAVNIENNTFQDYDIPYAIRDLHNKSMDMLLYGVFSEYLESCPTQNKSRNLWKSFISEFWSLQKDENTTYSPFAEVAIARKHGFECCLKEEDVMRAFIKTSIASKNALFLFKAIYLRHKFCIVLQGTEMYDQDIKTIVKLIDSYDYDSVAKGKSFKFMSERDGFDFFARVMIMLFNIFHEPVNTELEYQVREIVRTLMINALKSSSYSHLAEKINTRALQAICSKMWDLRGDHEFFGMSGGILSNALTKILKDYSDEIMPLLDE